MEAVVRDLENGSTGLDEALARYESGIGLLKHCYARLRLAEQKIALLSGTDEDGQPVVKPFDHAAAVEPEKPRRRARPAE